MKGFEKHNTDVVLVGGSAGSLKIITDIIAALPHHFSIPLIIIIHRQKNVASEMPRLLSRFNRTKKILEPEDKAPVQPGCIYLAPQNYHLLIEEDRTFSLDYSEPVHYSRPSIDVSFESAAPVYSTGALAILLSGANRDGASGMEKIIAHGGLGIIQQPATADYAIMPDKALHLNPAALVLSPLEIVHYIEGLNQVSS